jgi:hypothetical protein
MPVEDPDDYPLALLSFPGETLDNPFVLDELTTSAIDLSMQLSRDSDDDMAVVGAGDANDARAADGDYVLIGLDINADVAEEEDDITDWNNVIDVANERMHMGLY